jgi:endonuclease/exonuclease/phosphatase family metal-dependent hydrolase
LDSATVSKVLPPAVGLLRSGPRQLDAHPASAAEPAPLTVMTYNLRYASKLPPNAWFQRRPVAAAMLKELKPDIVGTQEGLYQQIKDLQTDLPDYAWIGTGRDGGSRGEFMAVFYRHERFEPLEFDHFWLSDTPETIGSTTWGNSNRRMVTWIRFLDRKTQEEFYFFNTHFDHEKQPAREKSATLIRERVDALKTKLPVILVGDFNAAALALIGSSRAVPSARFRRRSSPMRKTGNTQAIIFR